jgi:hypothetical protein
MFELNFNDDRYLPFEGAGVTSEWRLSLPKESNYFDFDSISDVILHINYTSRNSGGTLAQNAKANLATVLPNSAARLFSLKHEFSTEWYKFLNPDGGADQELVITLRPEHFPFFIRSKLNIMKFKTVDMFIETEDAGDFNCNMKLTNTAYANGLVVSQDPNFNDVQHLNRDVSGTPTNVLGEVRMKLKLAAAGDFKSLAADKIDNLFILFQMSS